MTQDVQYETHGKIIQRVPKTDTNIYGIRRVKSISANKPCIIAFGGERTNTIKDANYYASVLDKLLEFYGINNVKIYSVYYDFESNDRRYERTNAFINARSKILNKVNKLYAVDTKYIQDLYNTIIRPCIIDQNNKKRPEKDVLQNIRNIILFTHCHGATPVRTFQNMMARDMHEIGYEPHAVKNIMKNLLVIQHAPVAPLEKSQFNTVSFMSASDTAMNFHNKFSEYISEHSEDLYPSYFALGNFFATHSFTHQYVAEHQITGLIPNKEQDMLTPDGAIIMAAERNAIINGVRTAQNRVPVPDIRDLIAPASSNDVIKPDFDTLSDNGEFFMHVMRQDLRIDRSKKR